MKKIFTISLIVVLIIGCAPKKVVKPEAEAVKKIPATEINYFWVFKSNVNVRAKNFAASEKIFELIDGDSVRVLNNNNGWYEIETIDKKHGWVRSDLLGPKYLSVFKKAVAFSDSLKENENFEIFFDKKLYHKRIFISFPDLNNQSKEDVEKKVSSLVKDFQKKVYNGDVTATVIKAGTKKEYLTADFSGQVNADVILPVLPFGYIKEVLNEDPQKITLKINVPDNIEKNQLLPAARKMASVYPLSYKQIEIVMLSSDPSKKIKCRLWFKEDQDGESYKFDYCP